MKSFGMYLILWANFAAAEVAYYKKCYEEFSICLITNTDNNPYYWENKSKLTGTEAVKWCKANSSTLAIITTDTVQSAIRAFINDSSAKLDSDVITNCNRFKENTWKWVNGRPSDNRPSGSQVVYRYAYLVFSSDITFSLYDSPATTKRKFICSYVKQNSNCSDGYHQLGMTCYKMRSEVVTWFEARNLCLQEERSELAIVENGIPTFTSERREEYWIGLRKESWEWWNGQRYIDMKYSNWDDDNPGYAGGDCLCLKARTGKWTDCGCSQNYSYICIQDYSSSTLTITQSTLAATQTVTVDSTSQFHSNSTQILEDDFGNKVTENPDESQRLIIWIPLAVLIVVIAVVVSRIVIKKLRKRNRLASQGESSTTNTRQPASSVDTYATLNPETSTENKTYAELILYETIGDEVEENPK